MFRFLGYMVVVASALAGPGTSSPAKAAGPRHADDKRAAAAGQTVVVDAGDRARIDPPVSIALDPAPDAVRSLRLIETTNGQDVPVPSQVESGNPPRLWWIMRGTTPAQSKRTYRIDRGNAVAGPEVAVVREERLLEVRVGKSSILRYNTAHVEPPAGADPKYGRSAHIHPVWTPGGAVVTDEFPPDHLHQSGIFLAHTKTEFEGRTPNFWDLLGGTGRVRFKRVNSTAGGAVFGEIRVEHEHVDLTVPGGKVALQEIWAVRVWNIGGPEAGYWICDITSELSCATSNPLQLKQYHYGGMALRGSRAWNEAHCRFLTSEGKDRLTGNHTRPNWCDLSGPVGGRTAGLTFFTHPGNFRFPEPLRIHPTMPYMVYSPSQLGDWEIVPGKPHVSRYRFIIHDGDLPAKTADRLWQDWTDPLAAASSMSI